MPYNKAYAQKYYEANKEELRKKKLDYYYNNQAMMREAQNARKSDPQVKQKYWGTYIEQKYGITVEQYKKIEEQQEFKCAICKTETPGRNNNNWSVDHDHTTNAVRGLLCYSCNLLIGHAKDKITILEEAIKYIRKYS